MNIKVKMRWLTIRAFRYLPGWLFATYMVNLIAYHFNFVSLGIVQFYAGTMLVAMPLLSLQIAWRTVLFFSHYKITRVKDKDWIFNRMNN